jgi:hypothetical protein
MDKPMTDVLDLAQKFLVYGTLNSILAFGIIKTIKSSIQKKGEEERDIPVWSKVLITYLIAGVWYVMMGDFPWYAKLVQIIIIGSVSVAAYEAAISAFLSTIPLVFEAIKNKILPNK